MIILHVTQRSLDWKCKRLGMLTASTMRKCITASGALSKSEACLEAIDGLIAGLDCAAFLMANKEYYQYSEDATQAVIATYTGDKFAGNMHTQRGVEQEAEAIRMLERKIGCEIKPVGMCIMSDVVACSPDGIIYDSGTPMEGVEVKCPTLAKFYGYVAGGKLPDEYKLQVHSSLAITGLHAWHFAAYFQGRKIFHMPVIRDAYTDKLKASLEEFAGLYKERLAQLKAAYQAI